jgi:glycosyltransferase involved in cell wall biosynthesis
MDKITFCIPSKDNLRYLKTCIPSIRKNAHRDDHDIIIFVDQDTDGTMPWILANKDKYNFKYIVNPLLNEQRYGIGKAYDRCIEEAETDVVMIFHADMMLGKDADLFAFNQLKPKYAVSATRVEPPLHPNAGEKILRNFGMWPEEFAEAAFDKFVEENREETKTTEGIFAPWMVYKDEFLALGGHDGALHSCREDSDVFNRMLLDGWTFVQPWNSLVYHLTGRGAGSFSGDEQRHKEWQEEMNNSTKEFIRKWGSNVEHTPLMKPIVTKNFNKSIQLVNADKNLALMLEPWCSKLFTGEVLATEVKEELQGKTVFLDRVSSSFESHDIDLFIDGSTFNAQDFQYLQMMNKILEEQKPQGGEFKLGNIQVKVNRYNELSYSVHR